MQLNHIDQFKKCQITFVVFTVLLEKMTQKCLDKFFFQDNGLFSGSENIPILVTGL